MTKTTTAATNATTNLSAVEALRARLDNAGWDICPARWAMLTLAQKEAVALLLLEEYTGSHWCDSDSGGTLVFECPACARAFIQGKPFEDWWVLER